MCSGQSGLGRRKRGSQSPSKKSNTTTTKSTGPYAYPDGRSPPRPGNLEEIREALRQRRPSLSPSLFPDDKFDAFQQADEHATKESHIIADVIPIIEGNVEDRKCIGRQVPFTNLDHLTDGTLVPGNPDVYYGARPEQLDRNIRRELNGQIIPSTQQDLPLSPNFFLEVKGPDGSLSVASRQACYDGALGARGMHSLQSYGNSERRFDNQAYTLTSIYHGGQLKVYTSHPIPPSKPGAEPGYVMTLVKAWALTSDPDSFRQGAAGYRNGRDWAKQQRDEAIRQANEKVPEHGIAISVQTETLGSSFLGEASPCDTIEATSQETIKQPRSNAIPLFYDSNTSADELSLHSQPPPKRSHSPQKQLYTARSGQGQKLSEKEADLTPKNPFKNGKDFHLLPDSQEESE
ncbi:hypothetical protein QQZ08_001893 [Neonectria magnoliae]|uniref:Uncharacterized protein n=1 Tax=Neonectria magnoliae TaxID=2732573 RepID=A0ABR1IF91_9HYPO